MFTTSSVYNNSFLHRLNPIIKIVGFILIVAMIFIPLGFFSQIILFIILGSFFIISKVSRKTFWNIIKSVLVLFVLLFIINWIIYKEPITANLDGGFHFIGSRNTIWGPIWYNPNLPSNMIISNIWGGKINGVIINLDGIPEIPNMNNPLDRLHAIIKENNVSQQTLDRMWNSLNLNTKNSIFQALGYTTNTANPDEILTSKQFYWLISAKNFTVNGQEFDAIPFNGGLTIANGIVYFKTRWYTLSPMAIQLAAYVSIKVMLMIMVATLLTTTTNSLELTYGFEVLLSPFKIFRLPVNEASMMIAIALRFIPSLFSESKRIMNAQASRGIDFKNGGFLTKMKSLVSLVVPLFSIAFKKAEELANAIDARAYNPRYARTKYRKFGINSLEWIGFTFLSLLIGFYIGMAVNKIVFFPFGIFEVGLLC